MSNKWSDVPEPVKYPRGLNDDARSDDERIMARVLEIRRDPRLKGAKVCLELCSYVENLLTRLHCTQAKMQTRLLAAADQYEKNGEPGPLGYNCWGWRDIANAIRAIATDIDAEFASHDEA